MAWVATVRKILTSTLLLGGDNNAPLNQPIKDLEDRSTWLLPAVWTWNLSSLSLGAIATSGSLLSPGSGWSFSGLYAVPPEPGKYVLQVHYQVTDAATTLRLIQVNAANAYVATLGVAPIVSLGGKSEAVFVDMPAGHKVMARSEGGSAGQTGLVHVVAQGAV